MPASSIDAPASCETEERRSHDRGDGDADSEFDEKNPQVLSVDGVVVIEHAVVEKVAAKKKGRGPGAGVQEYTHGTCPLEQVRVDDALGLLDAPNERVEDESSRKNHPGLKASPGAVVAVELDVEGKQQDERDKHLGDHPQDDVVAHSWALGVGLLDPVERKALPINNRRPTPAVKMTVVSPSVS